MGQALNMQARLVTLLEGLSSVDSDKVFPAGTAVTGGYPYVTLEYLNETETDADEIHKWQIYRWRIRAYANMDKTGSGPEWAETTILTVLDELKAAVNADNSLGDTVDNMDWESLQGLYTPFEAGEARTLEGVLRVFAVVDES